eukprot:TRINITY_DN111803_c0_g1_i1.p1 TRINITY_DN111803_c0_g1~~TRINITY_DN111803_c0_g1_i1.p1  ORF type:complete len:242 (+),score=47.63 TRINITY_DN111803_c0_g1_i1:64-789(+)
MSDFESFSAKLGSQADYAILDALILKLADMMKGPVEAGVQSTAPETARATKENFFTQVLAADHCQCPAAHLSWALGVASMLATNVTRCKDMLLFAVKGSPACDCQLLFLRGLMPKLGFAIVDDYDENWDETETDSWAYVWQYRRSDKSLCTVKLLVCTTVQAWAAKPIHAMVYASQDRRAAPSLLRLAVVSAPLEDKDGEPIANSLNNILMAGLDKAIKLAEDKGFCPPEDDPAFEKYLME